MALKKLRPTTPGQRFRVAPAFDEVTASTPEKSLLAPIKKSGGRNDSGKMTMRYTGGGHKKKYRVIDFKRTKFGIPATVKTIEYDPNRTARIALLHYVDGEKAYIIAPAGLQVGTVVTSGPGIAPEVGNCLPLSDIPLGTIIHNIELQPGAGAILARSAGSYAQLVAREGRYATIKLPSGELRMVLVNCSATVGTVSNADHMNVQLGKAGRRRFSILPSFTKISLIYKFASSMRVSSFFSCQLDKADKRSFSSLSDPEFASNFSKFRALDTLLPRIKPATNLILRGEVGTLFNFATASMVIACLYLF